VLNHIILQNGWDEVRISPMVSKRICILARLLEVRWQGIACKGAFAVKSSYFKSISLPTVIISVLEHDVNYF